MEQLDIFKFVLKKLRTATQTQREIAECTGVPYSTLTKIAQGQIKNPGINHVQALANHFGYAPAVLEVKTHE